jgi:preprotein translocase subunit SecB
MEQSKFQFKNPNIRKISFIINDEFNADLYEGLKIDSATKVKRLGNGESAIVDLELMIGADDEKNPFYIDIEMEALFKWNDIPEEQRERLLATNAPSILVSYMRPVIAQITANSRYPRFDLPFLDMTENGIDEEL